MNFQLPLALVISFISFPVLASACYEDIAELRPHGSVPMAAEFKVCRGGTWESPAPGQYVDFFNQAERAGRTRSAMASSNLVMNSMSLWLTLKAVET